MQEKILSDFDLNHIVYLAVGEHVDENPDTKQKLSLEQIIEKKCREVEECGMSLWAFRPQGTSDRRKSIPKECTEYQDSNGNIFAVFTIDVKNNINKNRNAPPKSKKHIMHFYDVDGEMIKIPNSPFMEVTATRSTGDFALFVEEYYKIKEEDNISYCEQYDKGLGFGYEFLNKKESNTDNKKKKPKRVMYIAKLKAPFIVKVIE